MKTFEEQLADHKAAFDAGTLESFEAQHSRAVASGRPWRDVRDFYIGKGDPEKGRVIIYLTDAEIQEAIDFSEARIALSGQFEKSPPLTQEDEARVRANIESFRAAIGIEP